ncbi:MAG: BMP family ABC transporter substrate-binding protein, partial [Chloroflexota bacterium]
MPYTAGKAPSDRRVAFVADRAGTNDYGPNALALAGLRDAAGRLGLPAPNVLATSSPGRYLPVLDRAAAGAGLVVTIGPSMATAVAAAARTHPATRFELIGAPPGVPALPNLGATTFDLQRGAYLAGMLAAGTSGTHVVGFVGTVNGPAGHSLLGAFTSGAHAYDSATRVLFASSGSATDEASSKRVAQGLIARCADVLLSQCFVSGLG